MLRQLRRLGTLPEPRLFAPPVRRCSRLTGPSALPREPRQSDPLRILFCGSDAFSCASLRALHEEHVRGGDVVEALDVMVLPGRRVGRGLKMVKQVPCKILAQELGLRVHERETFREWHLPPGTNLVVVVSFGLFVPGRILSSAKYGGVNVHPSLLPDLRGPAPIHHALLRGDTHLGISLQTLDPNTFDHGTILDQTPPPGVPIPPDASFQTVMQEAAALGATMLVQGLRDGLHVPPHRDVGWKASQPQAQAHQAEETQTLQHAPKVTKADGRIGPDWTAEQFARRIRVLGSVWTTAVPHGRGAGKRIILLDAEPVSLERRQEEESVPPTDQQQGTLVCEYADEHGGPSQSHERRVRIARDGACWLHARDTAWIRVTKVKVDGKPEQTAAVGLRGFLRPAATP
ncbi:hypothetical protein E4U21_002064 [Claviceps maximensis]|nr:hypothetical protein E4U21_002064 [Claviceps maximensis]